MADTWHNLVLLIQAGLDNEAASLIRMASFAPAPVPVRLNPS